MTVTRYSATGRSAGQEISSTYEGRHLTAEESVLIHPYHADGFVDKGDPVLVGDSIVGVALNSAAAATDMIAFDTEGIRIPYPHVVVVQHTEHPEDVLAAAAAGQRRPGGTGASE